MRTAHCLRGGLPRIPALARFSGVNPSSSTIRIPPGWRSATFTFSAAGFIATRTNGASPGVRTSSSPKLTWNPLTPPSDPAGARISDGTSGSVRTTAPLMATMSANWLPATCIPSPESPANRTVAERAWTNCFVPAALPGMVVSVYEIFRPCRRSWCEAAGATMCSSISAGPSRCRQSRGCDQPHARGTEKRRPAPHAS